MKRYKISWVNRGVYKCEEEKPLSEKEIKERENNIMFFKNGRPKTSTMECMEKGVYQGYCVGNWCPHYASQSCDQHGCEWN